MKIISKLLEKIKESVKKEARAKLKKKAKKKIKKLIRRLVGAAVLCLVAVMLYKHRRLVMSAITGKKQAFRKCPVFRKR